MSKPFKFFSVTVFFVLLLVYTLYDYWNSGNSGFDDSNRGSVYFFLLLLAGYSFLYLVINRPHRFLSQGFTRAMLFIIVWLILCNVVTNRIGWMMYVHLFLAIWWMLSYYFFNTYCSVNPGSKDYILGLFSLFLLVYLYFAFVSQNRIQSDRETDHAVLNYAYNILAFLPFILMLKKKIIKYALIVLVIVAIFLSYKRGPLVLLPAMYIAYQFGLPNSKRDFAKQLLRLSLVLALFFGLFFLVNSVSGGFLSSRFSRAELQYGSSREELWSLAINDIRSRDFVTLLIGKGSGSSIDLLTSGVHNEWIEFLFSFGIIGVFIYFIFGASLLKKFFRMKKQKSNYAPIMGMLAVYFWVVGLFSGFYFVHATFYFFALLGMIDALNNNSLVHDYYGD